MNWKGRGRKRSWPNLKLGICPSSGQDLNPAFPEYEAKVLPTRGRFSELGAELSNSTIKCNSSQSHSYADLVTPNPRYLLSPLYQCHLFIELHNVTIACLIYTNTGGMLVGNSCMVQGVLLRC